MGVYNGQDTIEDSIESILEQSYRDFEFIIINDGSTDNSENIIRSYAKADNRIIFLSQENQGLTKTLNKAINLSRGSLIARQDADDISFPTRLEKQFKAFSNRPHLKLLGTRGITQYQSFLLESKKIKSEDIIRELFKENIFIHSSVMIDKEAFIELGLYNEEFKVTQDYEAWCRFATSGYQIDILDELLVHRYILEESISKNKILLQALNGFKVRKGIIPISQNIMLFLKQILANILPAPIIKILKKIINISNKI